MVARCLVEPGARADAFNAVRVADAYDNIDPALADYPLKQLVLVRGFITAIKHMGLRKIAPLTFRLLHAHNLDIAFFTSIAPTYLEARRKGPLPLAQLFARFEESLLAYLPGLSADAALSIDAMLRHEAHIWRAATASPQDSARGIGPKLVEGARVAHFTVDVLSLCESLSRDPHGRLPQPNRREQFLFYLPESSATRAFEVDALSAYVLSGLDGHRTLERVCLDAMSAFDFLTSELVKGLIDDAADHAMVVPSGSGRGS
ncbi:hypothetical protein BH10PSE14_BH10PSE14_11020 [soil metagenome]